MQKLVLLVCFIIAVSAKNKLNAQSIDNRIWKTFVSDPLNDTLVFHFRSDSSYVTDSRGNVMVRTHCIISGDTLTLEDYGSEPMSCIGRKGIYKINKTKTSFTLILIDDTCDGRSEALNNRIWIEAKKE